MSAFIQRSFAGGEISPAMYARVDQVKYQTGLRTCRNFVVQKWGGAANRAGTQLVAEVNDSSKEVRLIPFVFNADQTYVLEFGDQYMRVIKDGAVQSDSSATISTTSVADPVVVTTSGAHGFTTGDEVFISGVSGMTELNNRNFKITVTGGTTFSLQYMDGTTDVDGTGWSAGSGGTAQRVYEITTPYLEADLQDLQYAQSGNEVTIVHPDYEPRSLTRTSDTSWTLSEITFTPSLAYPEGLGGTFGAGAATLRYKVTAVNSDTAEESLVARGLLSTITGITQADPAVVTTSAAHNYADGDEVRITGVVGMDEVNDRDYVIDVLSATTFSLLNVDSTNYGAWSSGGSVGRTFVEFTSAASATPSWSAVADATEYNVYKEQDGVYGFIGVATDTQFPDTGITPDTSVTPPIHRNPFKGAGNFPSTVTFYQQRMGLAAPDNATQRAWFSRTGAFTDFSTSFPVQADDSVDFTLAGRQVNTIRHMLDLGRLVMFTTGGEILIAGDDSGTLTPTGINARTQGYYGSATLAPIVVGGNALFVQARGTVIRDLAFEFSVDQYRGNDLTVFADHLFENRSIRDWSLQLIPDSIVWAVMDDGALLGLTYIREHEVWGWHRHDFQGDSVEQIIVVPEGSEDAVYLVINRTITGLASLGGSTRRYIERMTTRRIDDIVDSIFMDSTLSTDGRHTGSTTMTLTTGTGWLYTDTLTLTASVATFAASDVGNQVFLYDSTGDIIRFTIDAFSSTTVVTGRPHKTVPTSLQATAADSWAMAVDQVGGLWHIEGEDVSVLGDAFVAASPNNAAYTTVTVTDGIATLDRHYAVIHVGLPYLSDMQTLDIDTSVGETLIDKSRLTNRITTTVQSSRGLWQGDRPPTDDTTDPLEGLRELKIRDDEDYDSPVALATTNVDINITAGWKRTGGVFTRQVDPIPLSILAIAPTGLVPTRG